MTAVDYFSSARSVDKLSAPLIGVALDSMKSFDDQMDSIDPSKREGSRIDAIRAAKKQVRILVRPQTTDMPALVAWLKTLSPEVRLEILDDPTLQKSLNLLDPTIWPISILQVLLSLFIGTIALVTASITLHLIHTDVSSVLGVRIWELRSATFYAIFFFCLYSILYQQYRHQMEAYVGSGSTTMQQFFVGILGALFLMVLASSKPPQTEFDGQFIVRLGVPILCIVAGIGAEYKKLQFLKSLIGKDTNLGTQVIMTILFISFSSYVVYQIWPRR